MRPLTSTLPLLEETPSGLYCEAGGFHIDPWRRVPRAVITHAHADHARPGSKHYLTTTDGCPVLRARLGPSAVIDSLDYGQDLCLNGVRLSLHPAGHVLGSAQVRLEYRGEVWVVSGDYKVVADATCLPFETVRCHTLITECTFGLPIYQWPRQDDVLQQINAWWRQCRDEHRVAVFLAYSLGKAQRVLAGLDPTIGPIICHSAVEHMNGVYREAGIELPPTESPETADPVAARKGPLVMLPPSAAGSGWLRKLGEMSVATASGWMLTRGARRGQTLDRRFVLSDHADWPGLLQAIRDSGADRVLVTHGHTAPMVRWLKEEHGLDSRSLTTQFRGESGDAPSQAGRSVSSDEDGGE